MNVRTKKLIKRIAVMCLVAFLLCTAYLIIEADHDCTGEECRICETIDALLTGAKEAASCFASAGAVRAAAVLLMLCAGLITVPFLPDTPVINKIRIDC
ncbi:MAG: hypothetical protein IKE27_10785 [Oscillospiraceae bacterium]|nr:hypothetical protein [Oscillospiraceae bacterium]